jgi:gas vesicle protein
MAEVERWSDERFSSVNKDEPRGGRELVLVLAGMAIGAGLSLLFTPRSGPEVRASIARGYRKMMDDLSGGAQSLRDRAQNITEGVRERVPNLLRFKRGAGRARFNAAP